MADKTIAIISDVHSNLAAFKAVLSEIDRLGINDIYSLGDTIGYGPYPIECTKLAIERCKIRITGNHEYSIRFPARYVNNPVAQKAMDWTRITLIKEGMLEEATNLPPSYSEDNILFAHGSARKTTTEYILETDKNGFSNFDRIVEQLENSFTTFNICFVGHNHLPFLATNQGFIHPHDDVNEFYLGDEKLYVSVGSVGQPRDDNPKACFVTFNGESIKYHRVPYPVEETARQIRRVGLPQILAERLFEGL